MTEEYKKVLEARTSLKFDIRFMENLLKHLHGVDKVLRNHAVFTSYCLHRYIQENLMDDVKVVIEENMPASPEK